MAFHGVAAQALLAQGMPLDAMAAQGMHVQAMHVQSMSIQARPHLGGQTRFRDFSIVGWW
jgi:hypothetical protein